MLFSFLVPCASFHLQPGKVPGGGGGPPPAAGWTDAMDESFAQPLARGLEGCPFRVEDLCRRVEEAPACREVAADLCALLRRQDI